MALASLGHAFPGASPWAPQYTCSIPVLIHMFNLCFSTYVLLKLSKLHFNLHQWHGTHCAQPAWQGQAPWTSESCHSSGIHRNPQESHWNSTGIRMESNRLRLNYSFIQVSFSSCAEIYTFLFFPCNFHTMFTPVLYPY